MVWGAKTRIAGRAVCAALLAVVCVLALAAVAAAATPTQIALSPDPAIVTYPSPAHLTGSITSGGAPLAGALLTLFEKPAGAADYSPAGRTATAGADGAFRLAVSPEGSTDYRVVFAGDAGHDAAQADARVGVRPAVTLSGLRDPWLGDTAALRGSVAPARPGAQVAVERRVNGSWEPLLTGTLDAGSRFRIDWTPFDAGYYRLRASVVADAAYEAASSASRRVIVNLPNRHHVPYKYPHYIVIVRHEFRLYYYEHGVLVRSFDVALGRPGYRTPLGYFHIYGKRKPAGGPLGACAMYYRRLGGIAIHGTDQPYLIRRPVPRDFSHGCARMLNKQALWLYRRVPVGTTVHNLR